MTNPCGSMCAGNALIQRLVQRMMRPFAPTSVEKIQKYKGKALIHEAQVDGICAQSESLRWWQPRMAATTDDPIPIGVPAFFGLPYSEMMWNLDLITEYDATLAL